MKAGIPVMLFLAGMPNKTNEPRVMLAFLVEPAWFQGKGLVTLPTSVKDFVESWSDELQFAADWVDEVDYKKIQSPDANFDTGSNVLEKYRKELAHRPPYFQTSH